MHTVEGALAHISLATLALTDRPVQLSEANQLVLHEALPPILVLHLECVLYDATADCIAKINFVPDLCSVA